MRKFRFTAIIFGWIPALLATMPLWGHHSISAEFDTSRSFTVTGTLTKIEWVNPHAYVYLDAKDDKGVVTSYSFETGPPGNLRRSGIIRTMFNVGDKVTIDAYASKDGSKYLGLVIFVPFCRRSHHRHLEKIRMKWKEANKPE